ncbi:hypothetical protein ACWDG1_09435 [Streptomyces sp. NPDC001177]
MSTVINIAYAVVILAFGIALMRISVTLRRPSEEERAAEAAARAGLDEHDVGPDALRLLGDLDDHLDQYFARLSHLFEELGPPPACDPAWDAGLERLWDAVRDEQQKEEQ